NQTSLTPGDTYYLSDTPGEISDTSGTVEKAIGVASSATQIILDVNFSNLPTTLEKEALQGTSGTPSSTNKYETDNDTTNGESVSDSTISFVASTKTIADSNSGLGGFRVGAT